MEAKIYGVIDSNECLLDTSKTEQGAKQYATRNGYNIIGFRVGYNAFILAEKINGKWVDYKEDYTEEGKQNKGTQKSPFGIGA